MFEYLDRIRKKTTVQKKRFAFGVSLVFSLIILGVWAVSVYPTLIEEKKINDKVSKIKSGPAESLFASFSGAWGDLKANVVGIKDSISNLGGNMDYYRATSTSQSTTTNESIQTGGMIITYPETTEEPKEESVFIETKEPEKQQQEPQVVATTTQTTPPLKVYGGM